MKQILIVEDEVIVASDLSITLKSEGFKISGIAHNYEEGLDSFKKLIPDLLICDINLGKGKSGIDLVRELKKIKDVPVVFLTAYSDRETFSEAFETLPNSYLTKPFSKNQILVTVERVLMNSEKAINNNRSKSVPKPTRREMDIIHFVAKGNSSREISKKLCISFETVQSHRKNILHKYDLSSSAELIAFATKNKWLS